MAPFQGFLTDFTLWIVTFHAFEEVDYRVLSCWWHKQSMKSLNGQGKVCKSLYSYNKNIRVQTCICFAIFILETYICLEINPSL